jgi:hypothetical protein
MAKRKRRKKKWTPPPRPPLAEEAQARQAKKEAARRDRERWIKRARRRVWVRRAVIIGTVLAVAGGVTGFILVRRGQEEQRQQEALLAAERIGCGEVQELPDEGRTHVDQPPTYGTRPATSGPHFAGPLPPDPRVYDQPFDATVEFRAVHNLEHGYVLIYYRQEGEGALDPSFVQALTELVEAEEEVILAPHPGLNEGTNLALTAWTRLEECTIANDAASDDVVLVAEDFIRRFRNAATAPEAAAA